MIFLRLELAEALRSRWALFTSAIYTLLFLAFVLLGLRESSVLGFTGITRVVLNVGNAIVLLVPLVALVATSQSIVAPRQNGFFELFLSQPVRRADWLRGAFLARFLVVAGPLVVLFALSLLFAGGLRGEASLGPMVARCLAVALALTFAFLGIGFFLSSVSRTAERATVFALVVWLFVSAFHDFALIGLLLQTRIPPRIVFFLAAANPVESARIAVLSAVDPELSVLGPVGFWIANSLGPRGTLALGVLWPTALGALGLVATARRIHRADLTS